MPKPGDPHPPSDREPSGRVDPWLDATVPPHLRSHPAHGRQAARPPHRPRGRRYGVIAAIAALLLIGLLFLLRPSLSEWLWPETRAQQLRQQAALALQAGRLTAPDGSGARELYEAALAIEPDQAEARDGLARVGRAALVQARAAIDRGRYREAHAALRLARELDVPRAQVGTLSERLREREAADAGLGRLLERAAAARAAGRLDGGPDAALSLYRRVLALQPGQVTALEGREDVLNDLLRLARQAMARGELGQAAPLIARVRDVDPGHLGLPDAIAALTEHMTRRRQQAAADLEQGRLDRALAGYRELLVADPDDAEAAHGWEQVAAAYAHRSERLASDFSFDEAVAALRQAQSIAPDAPAVVAAERHLQRARRSHTQLRDDLSGAEHDPRVQRLLEQAAAAEASGQLLTPPGESMFDKLRAARALAPRDRRVIEASKRLLPAALDCFGASLQRNDLGRAGDCLDAMRALGVDDDVLRESRRRLAQRWIAIGDQWLGAGQLADARRALQAARELDPEAPGLIEFGERVRTATPAAN